MSDSDLMLALIGYGAIGLVTSVLVIGSHFLEANKPQGELYKAMYPPEQLTPTQWVVKRILKPLLGFVVLIVVWPFAWFVGFMSVWEHYRRKAKDKAAVFSVKRKHLKTLCQLPDVEKNSLIRDPLGAVPALPFGHLNKVWCDFVQKKPDDAQLWSFDFVWGDRYGHKDRRSGYAWLRGREVADWVILGMDPVDSPD
jgi:hypothetical protein